MKGVKGASVFALHAPFNLVKGYAIDALHCIFLEVVLNLLSLWFDKSHRRKQYSIRGKVRKVPSTTGLGVHLL